MKRNITHPLLLLLGIVSLCLMQSCKENIDMSDRYTFKDYTIASYLTEHDTTYSEYIKLLKQVEISRRSSSTVYQLMSARGKYTMFAPTNRAIQDFLDTLYTKGIINEPSWDGFKDERSLDSIQKLIVYSSILDGTKDDVEPIQTGSFPDNKDPLPLSNMNDRKLTICYDKNPQYIYVNGDFDNDGNIIKGALIDLKNRDIFTINGYIHQVHSVVAPSNETLADVLQGYIDTGDGNYIVMAKMMQATGMTDTLTKIKDEVYENLKQTEDSRLEDIPERTDHKPSGELPEHRYYGYTLFAETDDFWRETLGKEPMDITPADIQAWVVQQGFYPEAKDNTDYEDEDNALNLFFTYHLLPMKLAPNKLVIHYNEKGYSYKTSRQYTVPVYEIYTTMGKRRLMKLYQGGPRYTLDGDSKMYINRFPVLADGLYDDYRELSVEPQNEGVVVDINSSMEIANAYIYPINKVLAYDENTREGLQKQRLRFDVISMMPEFMNNDLRDNRNKDLWNGLPIDDNYRYVDNLSLKEGTKFYFLSGLGWNWLNWQGDEINITGKYEVTFRLPPVPKAGTYEIRYAIQSNSERRSMCQVYFGTDPRNLHAQGIPLDLRMGGKYRHLPSTAGGNMPSIVGWLHDHDDLQDDEDAIAENDKKMRNNGYLKGPAIYAGTPGGSNFARGNEQNIRRIIVREYMYPEKVYYLKFKNVLDDDTKELYMDYFEYCAKEVYDNPMSPEDPW